MVALKPLRASAHRPLLLALGLGYLAFVIYGSLVPLHYTPRPWGEAVAHFRQIPYLHLGIGSRADWVANILLFIPLAFFWLGLLWSRSPLGRVLATVAVMAAGVALAVGIEFTQIFFPPRTVSMNDIIAEAVGTVIGIGVWWARGPSLVRWYDDWWRVKTPATLAERVAWTYLAVVFMYGVLPLDLTVSAVEIFRKWREGKLILIPFTGLPSEPGQAIYDVATDTLLWTPLAFLWRIVGNRRGMKVLGMTTGFAALLELLQLFVYSRVTSVTQVILAAVGGALGVFLGGRYAARMGTDVRTAERLPRSYIPETLLPLTLALLWIGGLAALFWYPYNFRTDGTFLRARLDDLLATVPFQAYYYGTEYRAATEVFRKVVFFAPLGVFLGWLVARLRWRWRGLASFLSLVLVAAVALAILLGRLALPEKSPDSMDLILEWLGGLLGFVVARLVVARRLHRVRVARPAVHSHEWRSWSTASAFTRGPPCEHRSSPPLQARSEDT
jgi:glycopeptide antibiotics resistance protein